VPEEISWEEIKERKRPARDEVQLCLEPWLAQLYAEAKAKVDDLRQSLEFRPQSADRQRALDDAEEALELARLEMEPHLVTFVVEAIGREAYEDLIDQHPPTKEQRDRWRKEHAQQASLGQGPRWNDDTFPPALISASAVQPRLSESQSRELWDGKVFSQGEAALLFVTCQAVNQNPRVVALGKDSSRTASSGSSSPSVLSTA
jgi:hypothetical protein